MNYKQLVKRVKANQLPTRMVGLELEKQPTKDTWRLY